VSGLDGFPSRTRLAELYRQRTGQELVLDGAVPCATDRPFRETIPPTDATKQPPRATIAWPVQLTLPWSCLVSDNAKYVARVAGTMEKPVAKLNLSPEYRQAKERIHELAISKLLGATPAAEPLQLQARVWVPDDLRAHDVPNFAKCVHDALEGAVYVKDRWLWRATWERAGVDVDAPRAEITITPLLP
jgi:Holliday junction resolvase RusA-like endonuclease